MFLKNIVERNIFTDWNLNPNFSSILLFEETFNFNSFCLSRLYITTEAVTSASVSAACERFRESTCQFSYFLIQGTSTLPGQAEHTVAMGLKRSNSGYVMGIWNRLQIHVRFTEFLLGLTLKPLVCKICYTDRHTNTYAKTCAYWYGFTCISIMEELCLSVSVQMYKYGCMNINRSQYYYMKYVYTDICV